MSPKKQIYAKYYKTQFITLTDSSNIEPNEKLYEFDIPRGIQYIYKSFGYGIMHIKINRYLISVYKPRSKILSFNFSNKYYPTYIYSCKDDGVICKRKAKKHS